MGGGEPEAKATKPEPTPFLVAISHPVIQFITARVEKGAERDEHGEVVSLRPSSFWPFGVAGASLFGLGLMGGYVFMSGDVKDDQPADFRKLKISEAELARNRGLAVRTASLRSASPVALLVVLIAPSSVHALCVC